MVKWIASIVAQVSGKNKQQPRPRSLYRWIEAPSGIDAILDHNLAAGRLAPRPEPEEGRG